MTSTRERLVEVAERLIAERGYHGVSLRTIGAEAGQANNSAAQYHFGSKEGLVRAIVEARSAPIDARRTELLTAIAAEREPGVADLVRVLVQPFAEAGDEQQTYYVRFLARIVHEPGLRELWETPGSWPQSHRQALALLGQRLIGMPRADLERRARWAGLIALHVLAEHEAASPPTGTTAQVVDETVAAVVALLEAPTIGAR